MRYLTNTSTDPHFNMAFDEWCLEHLDAGEPVFYLWRNRPSVIIGLNQDAAQEVNLPYLEAHGITLARRTTGGGAVYHDLQNLNYTFIGPLTGANTGLTPEPFVNALRKLGIPAELTGRNDIFVDGRKVSGYAKRIWKDRAMIHGTLMYDVDIDTLTEVLSTPESKLSRKGVASVRSRVTNLKDSLPDFPTLDALQAALHSELAGSDDGLELPAGALEEIRSLAEAKFATREWLYRKVSASSAHGDEM